MFKTIVFFAILSVALAVNYQVTFPTFDAAAVSNFQLNGQSASTNPNTNGVLRLTTNQDWVAGSAFLRDSITLTNSNSFSTAFSFNIHDPAGFSDNDGIGADGFLFVINSDTNQVGGVGQGLGFSGLPHSFGVEFDTYWNYDENDINGNHIGIDLSGSLHSVVSVAWPSRLNNGVQRYAWIDYNGNTHNLEVRVAETDERPVTATLSATVDLQSVLQSDNVFVGFTAATAAGQEFHDIVAWDFKNFYEPIDQGDCTTWSWDNQENNAIGYFCADNGASFWMCLPGAFASQSSKLACAAGTACQCYPGTECSEHQTVSPCTTL